jgi:hypothetical protein
LDLLSLIKKYYYASGTHVAMNDNGTVYYLLGDHLGSTSITANSGGGWYLDDVRVGSILPARSEPLVLSV